MKKVTGSKLPTPGVSQPLESGGRETGNMETRPEIDTRASPWDEPMTPVKSATRSSGWRPRSGPSRGISRPARPESAPFKDPAILQVMLRRKHLPNIFLGDASLPTIHLRWSNLVGNVTLIIRVVDWDT